MNGTLRKLTRRRFLALASGGVAVAATGTGLGRALASDQPRATANDIATVDPTDHRLGWLIGFLGSLGFVENSEWFQVNESSEWGGRGEDPPGVAIYATTAMLNSRTSELAVVTHVVSSEAAHLADRPPEAIVFGPPPSAPVKTWVGTADGVVVAL